MDAWNPGQYNRFVNERSRPFWDLSDLPDFSGAQRVLDTGCGTGDLTKQLHLKYRLPYTLGIDSSAKMLKEAEAHKSDGLHFQLAAAEDYNPAERFDVMISNAALHWVADHESLFPRLLSWLNPGGQLAVQMPANFDHPSHLLADEVGARFHLKPRQSPVLPLEDYARILSENHASDVNVFMKVYLHPMNSSREVAEWTKGSLLTHYQKQLTPDLFAEFLAQYTHELEERLGEGAYLYTFKRIFIYARRD